MKREIEISLLELARNDVFATPALAAAVAGVRRALREMACDPKLKRIIQRAAVPLEHRGRDASDGD